MRKALGVRPLYHPKYPAGLEDVLPSAQDGLQDAGCRQNSPQPCRCPDPGGLADPKAHHWLLQALGRRDGRASSPPEFPVYLSE